jgi:hypothetical protein
MLRKTSSPVTVDFDRAGGSLVLARVDIWKAAADGWELQASTEFKDAVKPTESASLALPKGSYTGVFQCFVQESLNGRYKFELRVGGKATFADSGDVNTTPSKDDTKVFKDQFVVEVR